MNDDYYYLNFKAQEGMDVSWAFSGIPTEVRQESCCLCHQVSCENPEYFKFYEDFVWYLDLAVTTRYADIKGRTKTKVKSLVFKNLICFMGPYVVIHLGKEQGIDESEAKIPHRFVLFDRLQIHRVLYEMHVGRNSLQCERNKSGSVRARWVSDPIGGGSRLFHRWLLQVNQSTMFVEHLNDIPLDCRNLNLTIDKGLTLNNQHTHRMGKVFKEDHDQKFEVLLAMMKDEVQDYIWCINSAPLLSDCVFVRKTFERTASIHSIENNFAIHAIERSNKRHKEISERTAFR